MQDAIILYENGKAIGGEGHPTDAGDITFDNTGTDLVSENVEDAIVEVNAKKTDKSTVLWENPSPTATFSAQNITLSSSDYDVIDWYYHYYGTNYCCSMSSLKGESVRLAESSVSSILSRVIVRNSDTSYTINEGYSGNAIDNSALIPLRAIGRKL